MCVCVCVCEYIYLCMSTYKDNFVRCITVRGSKDFFSFELELFETFHFVDLWWLPIWKRGIGDKPNPRF